MGLNCPGRGRRSHGAYCEVHPVRAFGLTIAPLVGGLALLAVPHPARSACNAIPGVTKDFRAALGGVDRPFASPGDFVTLRVRPGVCDEKSTGFSSRATNNVVTVVFAPTNTSDHRNVVVLTDKCDDVQAAIAGCEARSDVDSAICREVNKPGYPITLEVHDQVYEGSSLRSLRVRFPDTDDLLVPDGDNHTFSGPAKIAVKDKTRTDPANLLACELASERCATTASSGLVACVDELFELDGSCRTTQEYIDKTFGHFVALPPPNNYQAVCTAPNPPCTGAASEIRVTTDVEGNLLVPVDWQGVLVEQDNLPVPLLLSGKTAIDAFTITTGPITIPGGRFLDSFAPEGRRLPALFDPQFDPQAQNELTLFGSVDAPQTVVRLARRSAVFKECAGGTNNEWPCVEAGDCLEGGGTCAGPTTCKGGTNDGLSCTNDTNCPGGECGPSLFEFRDRYVNNVGPVLIPRFAVTAGVCEVGGNPCTSPADCGGGNCVDYRLEVQNTVALEGMAGTSEVFAFTRSEAIEADDLNGDGDQIDPVLEMRDRNTGGKLNIGAGIPPALGRAVAQLSEPPFQFPAVATEGDVVAFLEPEVMQGVQDTPLTQDTNANGNIFETILRVFKRSGGAAAEVTDTASPLTADPGLLINDRSIVLVDGLLFFRTRECDAAKQLTARVSVDSAGGEAHGHSRWPAISADGRYVAFQSEADDLLAGGDANSSIDVFVHDRDTDADGIFDEPGQIATERVSVPSGGGEGDSDSSLPAISADGRYVAFFSFADNLGGGDAGTWDIFLRDRSAGQTDWMSVAYGGTIRGWDVGSPAISADGRYVAFLALLAGDLKRDAFVYDRDTTTRKKVSVSSAGEEGNQDSFSPAISADGRYVAFQTDANNLVAGDPHWLRDIFVHDRDADGDAVFDEPGEIATVRVSVDSSGGEGNSSSFSPAISAAGRYVAFDSYATNLAAGDTNDYTDVYVHDRNTGRTERVSVGLGGADTDGGSGDASVSADGRYVAFLGGATNLDAGGDTNGVSDIFLRDRQTGQTKRVSVDEYGGPSNQVSYSPAISADGCHVAFESLAYDLVPGDTNDSCLRPWEPYDPVNCFDVFVRGPDPADPLGADLTGDGVLDATVLQVLDTTTGPPGTLTTLCPAETVAVAGSKAAFLRPESAGSATGCPAPGGGGALNGDGDAGDAVVHFWSGSSVDNYQCAASDVALSSTYVAALVPEADQGDGSLNGDADEEDQVVKVRSLSTPAPGACSDWTNIGQAADAVELSGAKVIFITPEAAQNNADLTNDSDTDDRVIQVYDAGTSTLVPVQDTSGRVQPAEEFVAGAELVAFRTSEGDLCGVAVDDSNCSAPSGCTVSTCDLNNDGDCCDDVLQAYDLVEGELVNSGSAVTPCTFGACDPRKPYRVSGATVKFLTYECDQGGSVKKKCSAGGTDLNGDGDAGDLLVQVFKVRAATVKNAGAVHKDAENLIDPLQGDPSDTEGTQVFVGTGRCIEKVGTSCEYSPCAPGEFCDDDGKCKRQQGLCVTKDDCPAKAKCDLGAVVSASADSDGDGVADDLDNCPTQSNVGQEDRDGDGVGDACDVQTCGDGTVQVDEECDGSDAPCGVGGHCFADCSCCATQTAVSDPAAKVKVKTRKDRGVLAARMELPLGSYSGEKVTVSLADTDSYPIRRENVGPLPSRGKSGKAWRFSVRGSGLRLVRLKDLGPRKAGMFKVVAKAKKWFTAAEANDTAANTVLTVKVGDQCFTHAVTTKAD